jgi:hypothetical protein
MVEVNSGVPFCTRGSELRTSSARMARRLPTQVGDVLILRSDRSFTIHVIGAVSKDGQQDFENQQMPLKYETDRAAAVAQAKALVAPGRRIFFRHLDTGEWSHISS